MPGEADAMGAAIDGLYRAFAGYPRPKWFYGCECCWGGDGAEPVVDGEHEGEVRVPAPGGTRDLRTLAADELGNVAAEVPLTAGTLDVFKHYLPRVFEIAAEDGFEWPDLEVVTGRLADRAVVGCMPWVEWPAPEVEAVRRFLHALWGYRLSVDGDEHAVDRALCAVGVADPDIGWYLAAWLRFDHPTASVNLERFLQLNIGDVATRGRLSNIYWHRNQPPAKQNVAAIVGWLRSPATAEAVAQAAERARSREEREALTACYQRWLPADRPRTS